MRSYLSDEDARKVLRVYQKDIARYVHARMQGHAWEQPEGGYEVEVRHGFTELKPSAYSTAAGEPVLNFRQAPADKSNMANYLFGGFARCLYAVQKFDSDPERILAVVLEREAEKWFRPSKGQFQLFYKLGTTVAEHQPDFVAETAEAVYMLEPKRRSELDDPVVLAKKRAAEEWCQHATNYLVQRNAKPWRYVLIPHDALAENKSLTGLAALFGQVAISAS